MEEQLNILRASNNDLLSDLFLDQGTARSDHNIIDLEFLIIDVIISMILQVGLGRFLLPRIMNILFL